MLQKSIISKLQQLDDLSINLTSLTIDRLNLIFSSNFTSSDQLNEYLKKLVIDKLNNMYQDHVLNSMNSISLPSVLLSHNQGNSLNPTSAFMSLFLLFLFMVINFYYYLKKRKPRKFGRRSHKNMEQLFHYQPTDFNREVVDRIKNNVGPYHPPFWYSPVLG